MNGAHRAKVAMCRRMVEEHTHLQSGTFNRQLRIELFRQWIVENHNVGARSSFALS